MFVLYTSQTGVSMYQFYGIMKYIVMLLVYFKEYKWNIMYNLCNNSQTVVDCFKEKDKHP